MSPDVEDPAAAPAPRDPLTAGALCTPIVAIARRDTPLVTAARRMREEHVGCLVVADESPAGDVVAGLLTDRDIVLRVVALGIDSGPLRVEDVMTAEVVVVREEAPLGETLALMRQHGVRRVPVVRAGAVLVGLLTFDDLLAALSLQAQAMTETLVAGRLREA